MPRMIMPSRFPATANDLATSVMRNLGQHMEIGCRMTFPERLNADVLRRAVRLTLDAQPILGCGLVTDFTTGWWERISGLDNRVPFSLVDAEGAEDAQAAAVAAQVAAIPDEGPQVAVTLVRGVTSDDVCFSISHNVADGQAAKQFAYLLAEIYSSLLENSEYMPRICLAERPSADDMWRRVSTEDRRAAGKEPRPVLPNWRLSRAGSSGAGRTLRELRLEPDRFLAMKACGKECGGATVNEMLLTAFFRAVVRCHPQPAGRALSLPFSVDHRRYLRDVPDIPISNLAITIWLGVDARPSEPFEATLARVAGQIALWRSALWGARSAVRATDMTSLGYKPMELVMKGIARMTARSGKTSPVFTNIGVLDHERLSFGGLAPSSARLSGPAAFGFSLVPTISTYRDTLTVSMGFCAEDVEPAEIERVLDAMDEEIGRSAGETAAA